MDSISRKIAISIFRVNLKIETAMFSEMLQNPQYSTLHIPESRNLATSCLSETQILQFGVAPDWCDLIRFQSRPACSLLFPKLPFFFCQPLRDSTLHSHHLTSSKLTKAGRLLLYIRELPSSTLARDTDYSEVFVVFLSPSSHMPWEFLH
jgi:hypothetical protein